jgi:hypothetical protein
MLSTHTFGTPLTIDMSVTNSYVISYITGIYLENIDTHNVKDNAEHLLRYNTPCQTLFISTTVKYTQIVPSNRVCTSFQHSTKELLTYLYDKIESN